MALDVSLVGRSYPPSRPYAVGREKIREFADAIGDPNPAYHDPQAARALGHPDVVAPPTFPIVLSFAAGEVVITDPDLGLDFSRVVHGDQRFSYTRPIHAGDELVTTMTIDRIRTLGGNDLLTTRADIATTDGDPVVTVYTMLVARSEAA